MFHLGDRVLRGLGPQAAADWQMLAMTEFFPAAMAAGRVVRTTEVDSAQVAVEGWTTVLEHEPIPFVSYPSEWTFEMLADAAVLHLDLLLAALDEGISLKDGSAYNIQWRGVTATFVDVGSFEAVAGPWPGYRQFCQLFLYPLMLEAHLDVPFQKYLAGHLDGLPPADMRRLLGGRHRFKAGVMRNVTLHAAAERRTTRSTQSVQADMAAAGYSVDLARATARSLRKLVLKLRSSRSASGWAAYRRTCSYSDEDAAAKADFVANVAESRRWSLAFDLGCNDGAFARMVAPHADSVVAVDSDDVTVGAFYRSLRTDGPANVLPLVVDLVDPTPARGWRGAERLAFTDRGRPDLVLALALVHHLVIAANVPMAEVVDWFASFGATLVVEFVEPHDPMAQRLLANKEPGQHDDYGIEEFESLLDASFDVMARQPLPSGRRTLYVARPRS